MRYIIGFLTLALALSLFGCATTAPIDKPLAPLVFQKEEVYVLDTSKIVEPDPPVFVMLVKNPDGSYRSTKPGETATFIAVTSDDIKKIDAMIEVKKAYKAISREEESLINIERDKLNALKEMICIERQSREAERVLRLDAEKAYRAERKDHRLDNIVNRGTLIFTILGGIAIAAL